MELKLYTIVNKDCSLESFVEDIDCYSGLDLMSYEDAVNRLGSNTAVQVMEITFKKI